MNQGQHDYARRKSLEIFDTWNEITGCFQVGGGYYSEMIGIIEDAVRIGSMVALDVPFRIVGGELKYNEEK